MLILYLDLSVSADLPEPSASREALAIVAADVNVAQSLCDPLRYIIHEYLLDPFPLLCASISVASGRLRTIIHRGVLSVIIEEVGWLRRICHADSSYSFWLPRHIEHRRGFKLQRVMRARLYKTFWVPVWTGEPRPEAQTITLEDLSPSDLEIETARACCITLGYPSKLLDVTQTRAPIIKHRRSRAKLREIVQLGANRDGRTPAEVARAIGKHHWPDEISSAVFAVVYECRKRRVVATERNLSVEKLSQYCWLVRKALRATPKKEISPLLPLAA